MKTENWKIDLNFIHKCMDTINKIYPGKEGGNHFMECPKCKNELLMSKSNYNYLIEGKCKTKDCLNWTQ